jgi:hypothetical protein
MKIDNLNISKFFWALTLFSAMTLFFLSMRQENGLVLSILFGVALAIPFGWIIGMAFALLYEGLKLCKPLLDWFFK